MPAQYLSISDAARELTDGYGQIVLPRTISDLFYARALEDDRCPVVAKRRVIPRDYLPKIIAELQRRGRLPAQPVASSSPVSASA